MSDDARTYWDSHHDTWWESAWEYGADHEPRERIPVREILADPRLKRRAGRLRYFTLGHGPEPENRASELVVQYDPHGTWIGSLSEHADGPEDSRADAVEVPGVTWGDYVGSAYERATWDHLRELHPEDVIVTRSNYWTYGLAVPLDHEVSVEFADWFSRLVEDGYLPDVETWETEEKIFDEAWEGYLARDARQYVANVLAGLQWDARPAADEDETLASRDRVSDGALRAAFDEARYQLAGWGYVECESAVDVAIREGGVFYRRMAALVLDEAQKEES